MTIEKATGSGVVRIRVRKVDVNLPFSSQEEAALTGIHAAQQILEWFKPFAKRQMKPSVASAV
jgi:hypothetical protein